MNDWIPLLIGFFITPITGCLLGLCKKKTADKLVAPVTIKEDIQVQIQQKQLEIRQLECRLNSEDYGGPFR